VASGARCSCRHSDAARSASPRAADTLSHDDDTSLSSSSRRSRRHERDDDDERRLGRRERWTLPSPSPLDQPRRAGPHRRTVPTRYFQTPGTAAAAAGWGKTRTSRLHDGGLPSVCAGPDEKVARRVHGDEPDRRIGRQRRRPARLHSLLDDNPVPRWIHAEPGKGGTTAAAAFAFGVIPKPPSTSTKTSKPGWPASLPTGASRTRHGCTRAGRFWRCAGPSSSGGRIGGSGSSGSSRRGCKRR